MLFVTPFLPLRDDTIRDQKKISTFRIRLLSEVYPVLKYVPSLFFLTVFRAFEPGDEIWNCMIF